MNIANYIEHTLLKPYTTKGDIDQLCQDAIEYTFKGVCVSPYYVKYASRILEDTFVKVVTVVGFPMGYSSTSSKVEEAKRAINDGADEIDMVINLSAVKNQEWNIVRQDIDSVATIVHLKGKIIKVILETALLNEEEMVKLCALCKELNIDYVKTSTGVTAEGASVAALKILKRELGDLPIKASGGIRDLAFAQELIKEGAIRLGTSSSLALVQAEKIVE